MSYTILVLFDVARIHAPVQHALTLLLIGSWCKDGMKAARIAVSGTWLWGGLNKINPNFLQSANLADPVLSMVLGEDLVERHRIPLHLFAALTEAASGFLLLLGSWGPSKKRTIGQRFLVLGIIVSIVFLMQMHIMILIRLYDLMWEYSVLAWNAHCLFLAPWMWSQWWQSKLSVEKKPSSGGSRAIFSCIAVFVVLPMFLSFGLIDPYLGISLCTSRTFVVIFDFFLNRISFPRLFLFRH